MYELYLFSCIFPCLSKKEKINKFQANRLASGFSITKIISTFFIVFGCGFVILKFFHLLDTLISLPFNPNILVIAENINLALYALFILTLPSIQPQFLKHKKEHISETD